MINPSQIKPHMPVVCSNNGQFAVVDHMEGTESIKLARDTHGIHHYIPLAWVTSVDDKLHVDRPGDQAMREWSTSPPDGKGAPGIKAPEAKAKADAPVSKATPVMGAVKAPAAAPPAKH